MNDQFAGLLRAYFEEMETPDIELGEGESYAFSFDDTVIAVATDEAGRELFFTGYVSDAPGNEDEVEPFCRAILRRCGNPDGVPCSFYYDAEFNGVLLQGSFPLAMVKAREFGQIMQGLVETINNVKKYINENFYIPTYESEAV